MTLIWASHSATSASITPGIGVVATSGAMIINVKKTTMYILTASNGGISVSDTVIIVVSTPGGLSCSITASSDSLPFGGGRVTLTWTSQRATSASITPGIGVVATSGDTTIDVNKSTMYIFTVSNSLGSLSDTVIIAVSTTWEFVYPLAHGNSWTYEYNYYYSSPSASREIHGMHTWSVVSEDSTYSLKTFHMIDRENDTTQSGSHVTVGTISKTFIIQVSKDSIFANWSVLMRGTGHPVTGIGHFPRFFSTQQDTLELGVLPEAVYVSNIGLVKYSNGFLSAQTFITEDLQFISGSIRSSQN